MVTTRCIIRDARIKAVQDVLDEWGARGLTVPPDIRRALA